MGTVAFAAKKKLIALSKVDSAITTALGTDGEVWDSSYSGVDRPRRLLWFGETQWESEEPVSLGALKRDETFNIRFGIEITDMDETQTESNDKLEALMTAVEAMLRDPRALQIGEIQSLGIVPIGIGEGPAGTFGRASLMAAQVRIKARK